MTNTESKTVKTINTTELEAMTKEELVVAVFEYENLLIALEEKISKVKPYVEGRKSQCLDILKKGPVTVAAIATRLGISARNVSSQLSYLRKDGVAIATDSLGRKFIEQTVETKPEVVLRKKAS